MSNNSSMKPISQPQVQDKKLQQFLKELNNLTTKYQYQLKPTLLFTDTGVTPRLTIINVPPKLEKKQKVDKV